MLLHGGLLNLDYIESNDLNRLHSIPYSSTSPLSLNPLNSILSQLADQFEDRLIYPDIRNVQLKRYHDSYPHAHLDVLDQIRYEDPDPLPYHTGFRLSLIIRKSHLEEVMRYIEITPEEIELIKAYPPKLCKNL